MSLETNTIFIIFNMKVSEDRTVNYGRIVAEILPQKTEKHHTWITVGGDLINLWGDITVITSYLTAAKLIFNIMLSTKM